MEKCKVINSWTAREEKHQGIPCEKNEQKKPEWYRDKRLWNPFKISNQGNVVNKKEYDRVKEDCDN